MKTLLIAALALLTTAAPAPAQSTPDVKGIWSGKWRTVILGQNQHHPGGSEVPRVREIAFTMEVEGQDGRLLWGKAWSSPDRKEPFVATFAADGRTIIGADTDGSLTMQMTGRRRIGACYAHPALSPSKSMVASCGTLQRAK